MVTYGFFNSRNGDRKYDAIDMSKIFDGIIRDGVFQHYGNALHVAAATDQLGVVIQSGRAWLDHCWILNEENTAISFSSPTGGNVIYSIALKVDKSARTGGIVAVAGGQANVPAPPSLTGSSSVTYMKLADVYIARYAIRVSQSNITKYIGQSTCPYVTAPLETMDIDQQVAQWRSQFQLFLADRAADNQNFLSEWKTTFNGQKAEIQQLIDDFEDNSTRIFTNFLNELRGQYNLWLDGIQGDFNREFNRLKTQLYNDVTSFLTTQETRVNNVISTWELTYERLRQQYLGIVQQIDNIEQNISDYFESTKEIFNNRITTMNNLISDVTNRMTLLDQEVADMRSDISTFKSTTDAKYQMFTNQINTAYNNFVNTANTNYRNFTNQISNITNNFMTQARSDIDNFITEVRTAEQNAFTAAMEASEKAAEALAYTTDVYNIAQNAEATKSEIQELNLMVESWVHGNTGIRIEEDTDNGEYYYNETKQKYIDAETSALNSKSHADRAEETLNHVVDAINEAVDMNVPNIIINLVDGHLYWEGGRFNFNVDEDYDHSTFGHLLWEVAV